MTNHETAYVCTVTQREGAYCYVKERDNSSALLNLLNGIQPMVQFTVEPEKEETP